MNYEIRRNGDIYSIKNDKVLKPQKVGPRRNYRGVSLRIDGKTKQCLIHILVATEFIPNPDNKPTVNHLDGDTTNNNDWNLAWATYAEQEKHSIEVLGKQFAKGGAHYRAKKIYQYTKDKLTLIAEHSCIMDAGRALGVSNSGTTSIAKVANSQPNRNTAFGFYWSYTILN